MIYPGERSQCAWEECSLIAIGWNVLYMSVWLIGPVVLFRASVSLLIFCLDVLSIIENGVLKSIVLLFLQCCQRLLYIFGCTVVAYIYIYNCYIFLMNIPFDCYIMSFISWQFLTSSLFCLIGVEAFCSLLVIICMEYLFSSFYFSAYM